MRALSFLHSLQFVVCTSIQRQIRLYGLFVVSEEHEEASSVGHPNTTEETSGADDNDVKQSSETESAGLMIEVYVE